MKYLFTLFSIVLFGYFGNSQNFQQPPRGPGSATYQHDAVERYDYAQKQDGYWLFEPASPRPESANVVVFLHGYGGYNPMIYGQWIEHLVRRGNVVVYPRYQKNMTTPSPKKFSENVVVAIQDALIQMQTPKHIQPIVDNLCIVGHSYGGTIAANITVNWDTYHIPKPKGIFLCAPGTGPFKAGILESYEGLPEELNLLILLNENDYVVGDKLGMKIFETATKTPKRNLIRQFVDSPNGISAGHNESYCVDTTFDSGVRNYTAKRALRISQTNAVDYYGYWKLFDALIECTQTGASCAVAFGNTPEQRNLGQLDEQPLLELRVEIPPDSKLLSEN